MVKKSMKFGFKIGGKLIEELKMAGRWLRQALGRHFGGFGRLLRALTAKEWK